MNRVFCEITQWWNWFYIRSQPSTHFYYYPVQLMIDKGFNAEVLTVLRPELGETQYEAHENLQIQRFARDSRFSFNIGFLSYLLKKSYSLIHLHDVDWFVDYLPWIASRIKSTPMVFTSHSPDLMESLLDWERMSFRRKMLLRNVFMLRDSQTCIFIAFTECQAALYRKIGIKNIRLIPHGIDPNVFQVERNEELTEKYGLDEHNLLCVGTIESRKGQLLLVEIMPRILKEFPSTKLLLLGRAHVQYQKDYLRMLKFHVARLNLEKRVVFLHDAPRSDLVQLYLLSSLFVLPTEAEMFGLVFLEAMAAGLPIVTTNKPYIQEIVGDGEAGVLVEREQKSLENSILSLLGDSSLRRRLGNNGKRTVKQKYCLDNVIQQYWDLYQSLLNQNK